MGNLRIHFLLLIILTGFQGRDIYSQSLPATEIIRKAEDKFNGEKSSMMDMSMTIVRPSWQRTVDFKSWSK